MTESFISQVSAYIKEQSLIPENSLVIAGFSGGADSLAMLLVLSACQRKFSFKLVAAHLNHGLRGQEADEDEAFVRTWCRQLDIPCYVERTDVGQYAAKHKIGFEEAGRECRQQLFSRVAKEQAQKEQTQKDVRIALAHHQQDQAETLLLHLGRGCGLDGLSGIKPRSGQMIRPLLTQPRSAIEAFLKSQQIKWREDSTNRSDFTLRNRIRHKLIPVWQQLMAHDPVSQLARTATLVAADRKLLADLLDPLYQACYNQHAFDYRQALTYDKTAAAHLLRRFWRERTNCEPNLAQIHIDQILNWLPRAVTGQQIDLPGQWCLIADGSYVLLEKKGMFTEKAGNILKDRYTESFLRVSDDKDNRSLEYTLEIPGLTRIPDLKLMIEAVLIENEGQIVYNNAMECFQYEKIQQAVLRFRHPGDRIYPLSGGGGKSLKKYFNEQKVKPYDRARMPLLAVGQDIAWIPGLMADKRYAVRPGDAYKDGIVCIKIHQQCSDNK